jgi:hypothetical protein
MDSLRGQGFVRASGVEITQDLLPGGHRQGVADEAEDPPAVVDLDP